MKVLFVDDEADLWIGRFKTYLGRYGLEFVEEQNAENVVARIVSEEPDIVLLDVMFPGPSGRLEPKGLSISSVIAERFPSMPIVMFTSTLLDMDFGIDERDFPNARFLFSKDRFSQELDSDPYDELAKQLIAAIQQSGKADEQLGFVVGKTPQMRKIAESILRVASTASTVLICGETGTGKELVARALHRLSGRTKNRFIAVNCGALTNDVLESALFGHERGAFTGADRQHLGFFEQAHQGTLFLDELDAMPSTLQDKLLRVLEDGSVRRMGSQTEVQVDVRLIAATNKQLLQLVEQGRFRQDLYYRICVVEIVLPPLRERLVDLSALFQTLVQRLNSRLGKTIGTEPRPDIIEKLSRYSWPGNIREFEHTLERAMITARANVLTPSTISLEENSVAVEMLVPALGLVPQILAGKAGWEQLKDLQGQTRRAVLEELISELGRQQESAPSSSQLANLLGVKESNMRRILSEAGVRLRRKAAEKR